jgi:hypothetical protein
MLSPLIHHSTKSLFEEKSIDDVLRRYDDLGPTARFCLELTPDQVESVIRSRDRKIASASPDLFKKVFLDGAQMEYNVLSHKICLLWRKRGSLLGHADYTAKLISAAVEQRVAQRIEEFTTDQLLDIWNSFSKFSDARRMAGPIFEVFVHRRFKTRIDLNAMPMVRSNNSNSRWHASFSTKLPPAATVHGVAEQKFSLHIDVGSTFVYHTTTTQPTLHIQPNVYYILRSDQQVVLDSFILSGGYLNIFQCTISDVHSIKDGLVDFLARCSGLPAQTHWRFVFVVPDDLDSFACPASKNDVVKKFVLHTAYISMSSATVT